MDTYALLQNVSFRYTVRMSTDDRFKIYVEQLRDGRTAKIDETFSSSFLAIEEGNLSFRGPVTVKGEAYLAGDELVLHLVVSALSVVPCIICNGPVEVAISLPNCYLAIPLEEIPHGVFSMEPLVREEILLETKPFAECNNGHCQHRSEISPYLKKEHEEHLTPPSPFSQLSRDDFE